MKIFRYWIVVYFCLFSSYLFSADYRLKYFYDLTFNVYLVLVQDANNLHPILARHYWSTIIFNNSINGGMIINNAYYNNDLPNFRLNRYEKIFKNRHYYNLVAEINQRIVQSLHNMNVNINLVQHPNFLQQHFVNVNVPGVGLLNNPNNWVLANPVHQNIIQNNIQNNAYLYIALYEVFNLM